MRTQIAARIPVEPEDGQCPEVPLIRHGSGNERCGIQTLSGGRDVLLHFLPRHGAEQILVHEKSADQEGDNGAPLEPGRVPPSGFNVVGSSHGERG